MLFVIATHLGKRWNGKRYRMVHKNLANLMELLSLSLLVKEIEGISTRLIELSSRFKRSDNSLQLLARSKARECLFDCINIKWENNRLILSREQDFLIEDSFIPSKDLSDEFEVVDGTNWKNFFWMYTNLNFYQKKLNTLYSYRLSISSFLIL